MVFRVLIILCLLSNTAIAATINAVSCSQSDVQAAINTASAGDIIKIPSGNVSWSSNIIITKNLLLIGSGKDSTIITSNFTAANPGSTFVHNNFLIVYSPASPSANSTFRISGVTLNLNNLCGGILLDNADVLNIPTKVRIDHNLIKNATNPNGTMRGILVKSVYGVIDNNVFEYCKQTIDSFGEDAASWQNLTYTYGTSNNIYYEDNTFIIDNTAHDAGVGSRYCARYNTYIFTPTDYNIGPWLMAHGNQTTGNTSTMG